MSNNKFCFQGEGEDYRDENVRGAGQRATEHYQTGELYNKVCVQSNYVLQ